MQRQRCSFVRFERERDCSLGMANWFSSDFHFPEEDAAAWEHCQAKAAFNMDMPFVVPQITPAEASSFHFDGYSSSSSLCPWSMPIDGFVEGKAASASRSHSEAEKRRRDRINAQLSTLRKLIPKSEKMDKAALLGSVVEHVKDLKRKAMEVGKIMAIPTDVDEVKIDYVNNEERKGSSSNIFLKASVCCEDRPELFSELNRALKNLRMTVIHADMISLGGRIQSIFVLCAEHSAEGGVCMDSLKQSLKVVLSRIATSCTASSYRIKSRRQRFFLP